MPDVLIRCQIRAGKSPEGDPSSLFVARLACAAESPDDLVPGDPLWPFIQPWRWQSIDWYMALSDGSFAAAATPGAHPHVPLDAPNAEATERSLGSLAPSGSGMPAEASAVIMRRVPQAPDPDDIELRPLPTHGPRTWLSALEGLGTGPGALARRLGLVSLLRPQVASVTRCLPGRTAFAPAFALSGEVYRPDRWETVRLPQESELDDANRNALLVTYVTAAGRTEIQALVQPSLFHSGSALSYVNAGTLEVALTGPAGQSARFDRDFLSALSAYETRLADRAWKDLFKAFLHADDQAGLRQSRAIAAEFAVRSALLARQDVTAAFLLRQWHDALSGPEGTGYQMAPAQSLPIAQASVAAGTPGTPGTWITLIPRFASSGTGPQPFRLDLLINPTALVMGDLVALKLTANPAGSAAGGKLEIALAMTAAGAQWRIAGADFGQPFVADAQGIVRLTGVVWVADGHTPIAVTLAGETKEFSILGTEPPLLELEARQNMTVSFGPAGLADLLGRSASDDGTGKELFFSSRFAERLARLDPQGWLIQGPPTLAGKLASGGATTPDPSQPIRQRLLDAVSEAFAAWLEARMDAVNCRPLLPLTTDPADNDKLTHLKTILLARFRETFGKMAARQSTSIIPLDSGEAVDLPIPDAHPIVVPYDLGDAVSLNDLLGETTGVAVLVEADGRAFAPDHASETRFAGTFTLNAARLVYAGGDDDQELAVGSRPNPREGADIRTFSYDARPLVAPLPAEENNKEQPFEDVYAIRPFTATGDDDWGRLIPQMRFGWTYRFRSFLMAQGGALPPDLWKDGNPAKLRRPAVGETRGFGEPFVYLCRSPIGAPRWAKTPAGRIPDGSRPLAGELPDLPPPIDIPEASTATFYVSEQDGSGLLPYTAATPLEIRLYGLRLAEGGEAILTLRSGRVGGPDDRLRIRIRQGVTASLGVEDGDVVAVLPDTMRDRYGDVDIGEWHLQLTVSLGVSTVTVCAALLMEADLGRMVAVLEPDLVHVVHSLGDNVAVAAQTEPDEVHVAITAAIGALRVVPPRVWAGPFRQTCPETAGQQPETVALDSRSGDMTVDIRPPGATFATWVRHLLSDKALFDNSLRTRIDGAYHASPPGRPGLAKAVLDHPRVTALFVELVPLFPRTRTSGRLFEIPLRSDAVKDPYGDYKRGPRLTIRRGSRKAFDPDDAAVRIDVQGSDVVISVDQGRTAEVRVYGGVKLNEFTGSTARFAAALARGCRREGEFVLGAPLRLRVESSADALLVDDIISPDAWRARLTGQTADTFADWKELIVDGTGRLQRVEARPRLAAPKNRATARILRLFAAVTVYDQQWSWRGRTGSEAAPPQSSGGSDHFAAWSARLFYGRADKDAESGNPIPLLSQHIRRRDSLEQAPEMWLTERDITYRGAPMLWRFSAEFHGRYPNETDFNRHTLDGSSKEGVEARHARWAHFIAPGALSPPGGTLGKPPEQRRPAFEVWLPLAEQLRETSATAPVLLMFREPWHAQGDLGDRLQVVTLLARHPYPEAFSGAADEPVWPNGELRALFGDDPAFDTALQYPKFRQSWAPDPILSGAGAKFQAVTLALSGPLGWTQSEGAHSDFRRTSFLLEPQANDSLADLLALRPMFQLAYRRILDPSLVDLPRNLLRGEALWQTATESGPLALPRLCLDWSFFPPQTQTTTSFSGQPAGYQGLRFDWIPADLTNGAPVILRLEDAATLGSVPRRLVVMLEKAHGRARLRAAMSEPLMDLQTTGWRINHLPPIEFPVLANSAVTLRLEVSPTAPVAENQDAVPPDTFDVVISAKSVSSSQWEGGMLARFKAPQGNGTLRFDLPGTATVLGATTDLRPFAASPFSGGFWTQFFSDSSRFRCQILGAPLVSVCKIEALRLRVSNNRITFTTLGQASEAVTSVQPLLPEDRTSGGAAGSSHRLVAIVTRWITDAEGRRSEFPVFAAPVHTEDTMGSYVKFPPNAWPATGRLRLLTVFATKEAREFSNDDEADQSAPFRIMDAILHAKNATETDASADVAPFDLDNAKSEMREVSMMIIGVSRPLEFI